MPVVGYSLVIGGVNACDVLVIYHVLDDTLDTTVQLKVYYTKLEPTPDVKLPVCVGISAEKMSRSPGNCLGELADFYIGVIR